MTSQTRPASKQQQELGEAGRGPESSSSIELQDRALDGCRNVNVGELGDEETRSTCQARETRALDSYTRGLWHWWSHNISLVVERSERTPHGRSGDPRGYLALERTHLGWIRTSSALVSFGVVITQLYILRDADRTIGIVLSIILSCGGIIIALLGSVRYFAIQRLLVQGKAVAGGLHVVILIALLLLILLALFISLVVKG